MDKRLKIYLHVYAGITTLITGAYIFICTVHSMQPEQSQSLTTLLWEYVPHLVLFAIVAFLGTVGFYSINTANKLHEHKN